MVVSASGRPSRALLPYHVLVSVNPWYFAVFFLFEMAIFIYKGLSFTYAGYVLAAEIIFVVILAGLEFVRLFLGHKGNLTENVVAVCLSLVFSVPSLFGALYFLLWETYVLRADVILSSVQIAFIGLETIFAIVAIIRFLR